MGKKKKKFNRKYNKKPMPKDHLDNDPAMGKPLAEAIVEMHKALSLQGAKRWNDGVARFNQQLRDSGVRYVKEITQDLLVDILQRSKDGEWGQSTEYGLFNESQVMKYCCKRWSQRGYLARDPSLELNIKRPPQSFTRRPLEKEEWKYIRDHIHMVPRRPKLADTHPFVVDFQERLNFYETAIATGYRAGEMCSLETDNVFVGAEGMDSYITCRNTKNSKLGKQYITRGLAIRIVAKGKERGTETLFPGPGRCGGAASTIISQCFNWDIDHLRQQYEKDMGRLLQPHDIFLKRFAPGDLRLSLHSLRHTLATWLIRAGTDVNTSQAMLRHASPSTTLSWYSKAESDATRNAVKMIGDALQG